jgi:Putative transposase
MQQPSPLGWHRCDSVSGWSTPSVPSQDPKAVLAYLSRYTHRVAISNSRLLVLNERGVTFRWKDYRAKGRTRHKTMTLTTPKFMRRFLLHVLPHAPRSCIGNSPDAAISGLRQILQRTEWLLVHVRVEFHSPVRKLSCGCVEESHPDSAVFRDTD